MPPTKQSSKKHSKASSLFGIQRSEPRTRNQHATANCKIFTLNDDCLLEVFSYLATIDLCAVKDTCRRFNALTNSIVQQRWKGKAFNCGHAGGRDQMQNTLILQHFGHVTENVMIMKQENVWPVKKCGAKKVWVQLKHYTALKKLTMFDTTVNRLPIYKLRKVLQNLESLDLLGCVGADSEFARIINACKSLKKLRITHGASILLLASIGHEYSNIEFLDFTPRYSNSPFTDELPQGVNEITHGENLSKVQKLRKLKSLCVVCDTFTVTSAIAPLAKKTSLESIKLFNANSDKDLVRAFEKWTVVKEADCWLRKGTSSYEFHRNTPTIPTIKIF